jgi:hypothetical protein
MIDGKNVKAEVKGDKLVLEINLKEDHGPSKSGKTRIIATTSGNQKIAGTDVVLGLNCYRKI